MEDEKRLRPEGEDVEAHELRDRPSADRPDMEAQAEEPEVEGHLLSNRPDMERPSAE